MKLTCQILNYNDANHVISLINKISHYRLIDNILIIDNCSTDSSYSCLKKKYLNKNNIKVIRTKKNLGYGGGNNFGVNFAYYKLKSDYILLANTDISFTENVVNQLVNNIKDKNVAISAPTQRVNGQVIRDRAWKIPSKFEYILAGTKIANLFSLDSLYPDYYFSASKSFVDCVPGAMLLIDPIKFLDVGGFDERMFLYCEETTIGFKLKQDNYKTLLLNDVYYDHLQSASIDKSIPNAVKKRKYLFTNRLIFLRDYLKVNYIYLYLAKNLYNHILKKINKRGKSNGCK